MADSYHVLVTTHQLGQMLQASRKARKLSQASLAGQIGLSQSRVSSLEQRAGDLNLEQLLAWCAALDLELRLGPRQEPQGSMPATDW